MVGLVGQCGTVHDVADGIDAWHIGAVPFVHIDFAALSADAEFLEAKVVDVGLHANGAEHDVGLHGLLALLGGDGAHALLA